MTVASGLNYKVQIPMLIRVSESAARVYAAVSNSPGRTFRFGYGKLAVVADLTDPEARRGVEELRRYGFLRLPQCQRGRQQAFVDPSRAAKPLVDLGSRALKEIASLARVDFDRSLKVPPCRQLIFDSKHEPPPAWMFDLRHIGVSSKPNEQLKLKVVSSPQSYLDYLLFGESAFGDASRRVRAYSNWTPALGDHANDLGVTDSGSCNDISLAAYWAWSVGYQRALHGQPLLFPRAEDVAHDISAMVKRYSLHTTIQMLGYAAFKWRTLARLVPLRSKCLGRFPNDDCWRDPIFAEVLYERLSKRQTR